MTEKVINKPIRARNMYDMKRNIAIQQINGYKIVGKILETREGTFHALMRKVIVWEERK